jgi:hypothetical protein
MPFDSKLFLGNIEEGAQKRIEVLAEDAKHYRVLALRAR